VEFLEKEDLNEYINKWKSENQLKEKSFASPNIEETSKKLIVDEKSEFDLIEKSSNSNIPDKKGLAEDVKRFYCTNCNLYLRNEFHFENENSKCKFSKKDLLENLNESSSANNKKFDNINNEKKNLSKAEILEIDSNQLMKKYNEFNTEINDLYENYMKTILINYIDSHEILHQKINANRLFENLIIAGIITENHFTKMLNFMLKYHKNKKLTKLIKDFSSDTNINNEIEDNINNNDNPKEKFDQFLNELNSLEKIYANFKVNEFLSEYFFFQSVIQDFKKNLLNKLERLEGLFTVNSYKIKDIEEDERKFKSKQAKDICNIYNRDIIQNLVSEISNDINFSQQKNISNIKYSYFFIKKSKILNKKNESNSLFDLALNKLNLIVFDPLTETLKKFDLELLIDQIEEIYEKYKVNYSKICLKIKYLKKFDFNFDQFGNIFLYGGYFKKLNNNISNAEENTQNKINNNNNIPDKNIEYTPIFKINPFKKKFKVFYELANPRFASASIIINKDFYFLGGKSFENFLADKQNSNKAKIKDVKDFKQIKFGRSFKVLSLKNLTLSTLIEYPLELKQKPLILNHIYENIFVCEDIKNFSFYNLKKKKWKKSQIFYDSENITNISNFVGFNFDKDLILLGGIKNIKQNNFYLNKEKDETSEIDKSNNNDEYAIKEDIKDYNNQILSIEKEYYSVSNVGCSNFHFADLYEKKFGKNKILEIEKIESDVAYLSDSSYILEHHTALGMIYIKKNTRLKSGLDFESFILEKIDEI
jgi:hypothetical protein